MNFTVSVNATYFPYKDPIGLQYQFDNGTDVDVVAEISGADCGSQPVVEDVDRFGGELTLFLLILIHFCFCFDM